MMGPIDLDVAGLEAKVRVVPLWAISAGIGLIAFVFFMLGGLFGIILGKLIL